MNCGAIPCDKRKNREQGPGSVFGQRSENKIKNQWDKAGPATKCEGKRFVKRHTGKRGKGANHTQGKKENV